MSHKPTTKSPSKTMEEQIRLFFEKLNQKEEKRENEKEEQININKN